MSGTIVYRITGLAMGSYLYVGEPSATGNIVLLFYPGWDGLTAMKAKRLIISIK